ncbi:hypothetical protein Agabi119p4_9368 [Agaricus bisporus var. burnettii]|uniref:Uncharacterized protein n=1 Tax=Agaricus bisporus var. burnettii TaxID=192524 RepID=A0A8H7C3M7_AGABI|nr:hypothetical protein Agabi119p4_9368 [Agaricus bisporus var. burnettii]
MASSNQPYPYSGNGTKPSPPSPSSSSPGLTQSTSNSSGSPPQPSTPPRRQNKRQIDQGRIPLHRRGTSRTYENLEDLLREAGYKETRIYTPESDRLEPHAREEEGDQPAGKVQGVRAAVVGFLTALVTGTGNDTAASPSGQQSDEQQRPRFSRTQSPSSPLTDRQQVSPYLRENARSMESIEPPFITSSSESLGGSSSKTRRQQHYQSKIPSQPSTPNSPEELSYSSTSGYQTCRDLHHTQSMSRFPHHHLHQHRHQNHRHPATRSRIHNQASWPSITTSSNNNVISLNPSNDTGTTSNNSTILINDPIPSRAGTYLRHVISTPTIVSPPSNLTPRNQSNSGTEGGSALPRKWLDSVTRVLTLGVGTSTLSSSPTPNTSPSSPVMAFPSHLPPPSSFHHPHPHPHNHYYQHHPHHQQTLRTSRSTISQTTYKSALSATTTTTRSRLGTIDNQTSFGPLTPPVFLTRFERERAPCSQSQVSRARVYCRSAPASRAPSPSRFSFYYHNNKSKNSNNKKNDSKDPHNSNNNGGGRGGRGLGKRVHYHAQRGGGMLGSRRRNWRRKKGEEESLRVPSLAKTRVEGDGWHKSGGKGRRQGSAYSDNNDDPFSSNNKNDDRHHRHRHPQQQQQQHPSFRYDDDGESCDEFYEDEEEDEEDEEDEEGELDLAKMLVNPKRQQSIRSLRKHLHHSRQQQLLTPPSSPFIDPSKNGLTALNATHPDTITNPSLSRLPPTTITGHQRRFASGKQTSTTYQSNNDDTAGQWERQWRSGELTSSRRGSEDDDLYESLTWLNDDKVDNSMKKKDSAKGLQ